MPVTPYALFAALANSTSKPSSAKSPSSDMTLSKVVVFGPTGSGKTHLVRKLCGYPVTIPTTDEVQLDTFKIEGEKTQHHFQCWDIPGAQLSSSKSSHYLKGTNVYLFVIDISMPSSNLEMINAVKQFIRSSRIPAEKILFVANKTDLDSDAHLSIEQRRQLSEDIFGEGATFLECSTLNDSDVDAIREAVYRVAISLSEEADAASSAVPAIEPSHDASKGVTTPLLGQDDDDDAPAMVGCVGLKCAIM